MERQVGQAERQHGDACFDKTSQSGGGQQEGTNSAGRKNVAPDMPGLPQQKADDAEQQPGHHDTQSDIDRQNPQSIKHRKPLSNLWNSRWLFALSI